MDTSRPTPLDVGRDEPTALDEEGTSDWSGNVLLEAGFDGQALGRAGGGARVGWRRLEVETEAIAYAGEQAAPPLLGHAGMTFAPVRTERVAWRLGLGGSYQALRRNGGWAGAGGPIALTRVDLFPCRFVVLGGRVAAGTSDGLRDALFVSDVSAGLMLNGFEIYAGYDLYWSSRFLAHGTTVGIRLWL